jgi:hypothetical protein
MPCKDANVGQVKPRDGKWTMQGGPRRELVFVDGKKLSNWGLLDLVRTDDRACNAFVDALYDEGAKRGLSIEYPVVKHSDPRNLVSNTNIALRIWKGSVASNLSDPIVFSFI